MTVHINIEQLKRDARRLSKTTGEPHGRCIEELARQHGFKTYAALRAAVLPPKPPQTRSSRHEH